MSTLLHFARAAGLVLGLVAGCTDSTADHTAPAPAASEPAPAPTPDPPPRPAPEQTPEQAPAPPPGAVMSSSSVQTAPDFAEAVADYARLLGEIVTDDGLVRYDLLEGDRQRRLDVIVAAYATAPPPPAVRDRLAFWCNAYNANVLAAANRASRRDGFENVLKVPGFFDERRIMVGEEAMTLNALENERIRLLGDPRIHAALVCAARSCPPLRAEPYRADDLDEQLDDQCRRWVRDETKFRLEGGRLGVSAILKWYAEDFTITRYGNATGFVLAYSDPARDVARYIVQSAAPEVIYLPYDWSLNAAPKERATGDTSGD